MTIDVAMWEKLHLFGHIHWMKETYLLKTLPLCPWERVQIQKVRKWLEDITEQHGRCVQELYTKAQIEVQCMTGS